MLGPLASQVVLSTALKGIGSGFRTMDAAKTGDNALLWSEVKQEASLLGIVGSSTFALNSLLTKVGAVKAFPRLAPAFGIGIAYILGESLSRNFSGIRSQLQRAVAGPESAPQTPMHSSKSSSGFSLFAGNPNQLQSSMNAAGGNYQPVGFTQVANTFQRIA